MLKTICQQKKCKWLRRKTVYFPMYKIEFYCDKKMSELGKVRECPLDDPRLKPRR